MQVHACTLHKTTVKILSLRVVFANLERLCDLKLTRYSLLSTTHHIAFMMAKAATETYIESKRGKTIEGPL